MLDNCVNCKAFDELMNNNLCNDCYDKEIRLFSLSLEYGDGLNE